MQFVTHSHMDFVTHSHIKFVTHSWTGSMGARIAVLLMANLAPVHVTNSCVEFVSHSYIVRDSFNNGQRWGTYCSFVDGESCTYICDVSGVRDSLMCVVRDSFLCEVRVYMFWGTFYCCVILKGASCLCMRRT